jgi:hypothetical protein
MTHKKPTNHVLAANGGLDSRRTMKLLEQVMVTHDLKQAVLYQFILSGSDKAEYQATMRALMRHIRTKCRAEYIGGYEVGEEKNGLHAHAFVIIETAHHFPSDLLDVSEGEFIARRIKRKAKEAEKAGLDKSLSIRIEPPKNKMHGGAMFARMNTPAKLADCVKWASYFVKVRSKADVPGRETYFGSEFASNIAKREAQRQKYRDALTKSTKKEQVQPAPVEQTSQEIIEPTNTNDGEEMNTNDQLSKSAFNFLGAIYEECVDAEMNLTEIQAYLSSRGIHKQLLAIKNDLRNVYGFHGYVEKHPAPPRLTLAQIDSVITNTGMSRRAAKLGLSVSSRPFAG